MIHDLSQALNEEREARRSALEDNARLRSEVDGELWVPPAALADEGGATTGGDLSLGGFAKTISAHHRDTGFLH